MTKEKEKIRSETARVKEIKEHVIATLNAAHIDSSFMHCSIYLSPRGLILRNLACANDPLTLNAPTIRAMTINYDNGDDDDDDGDDDEVPTQWILKRTLLFRLQFQKFHRRLLSLS